MLSANYECDGQMSLFDLDMFSAKFDYLSELAKRGSPFSHGKERIADFFSNEKSTRKRVAFLKNEYGSGGFCGSPVSGNGICAFDSTPYRKPNCVECEYIENGERHTAYPSWAEFCNAIDSLIISGLYLQKKNNG